MSNYLVVEFEDGIQLVPECWLNTERTLCSFPDFDVMKYNRAVKNRTGADPHWPVYPVLRIIATAATYDDGRTKLIRAEYRTDVENTTSDDDQPLRKKSRYMENNSFTVQHPLPNPPMQRKSINFDGQNPRSPLLDVQPNTSNNVGERSRTNIHTGRLSGAAGISKMALDIEMIKETQIEILKELASLKNSLNVGATTEEMPDVLPRFPLSKEEELDKLDMELNDPIVRSKLVSELRKIGGSTMTNIVYRILQHVMEPALGNCFSYFGTKNKRAFSVLNLCSVVADVARAHKSELTNEEVKEPIQNWLRHTKEKCAKFKIV